MFTKQKIIDLEKKVDKLTALLESNEIKQLRKDSDELKKTKELLSHVKFKIKETRIVENQDNGNVSIIVTYEMPRIVLELDENGSPNKNDFFYSSNMLDMISLEDMSRFQDKLKAAQTRVKKSVSGGKE